MSPRPRAARNESQIAATSGRGITLMGTWPVSVSPVVPSRIVTVTM